MRESVVLRQSRCQSPGRARHCHRLKYDDGDPGEHFLGNDEPEFEVLADLAIRLSEECVRVLQSSHPPPCLSTYTEYTVLHTLNRMLVLARALMAGARFAKGSHDDWNSNGEAHS